MVGSIQTPNSDTVVSSQATGESKSQVPLDSKPANSSSDDTLQQRWQFCEADTDDFNALGNELRHYFPEQPALQTLFARILANRQISSAKDFLEPETVFLPDPRDDFPDLGRSVERLAEAIQEGEAIAICGDYDADGMTSTALLMRTFRALGAQAQYEIPSRMTEGYGINERIVRDLYEAGISVLVTVDNGIAAYDPIALAKELGMTTIITDHHDIPERVPPADAILNPKLIAEESPYRGMAGVGIAYLLALELADEFGKKEVLATPLLELLTLGTIADLAPLTGINRRWVKAGLAHLPHSQLTGVQALMQVTGLSDRRDSLQPEAIGFGLGPRINAVGRLGQPAVVIELLTTDDDGVALEKAMACEQLNLQRRQLCTDIEAAALNQITEEQIDPRGDRCLAILGEGWHHGVIGIVASRLLERFHVPVFIASLEEDGSIRGSARGIPGFNVFEAIEYCRDLFEKAGGHPAAGGFSMQVEQWTAFQDRLREYAHANLVPSDLHPLIEIDSDLPLEQINSELYVELQRLQPFGIGNREPVFYCQGLAVAQQRRIGKTGDHLKVQLKWRQASDSKKTVIPREAIAWRQGDWYPLPKVVDVAFKIRENRWRGEVSIELEASGFRPSMQPSGDSQQLNLLGVSSSESPRLKPKTYARGQQSIHKPKLKEKAPKFGLSLVYQAAPSLKVPLKWRRIEHYSEVLTQYEGTVLVYGCERPNIPSSDRLTIHCDRPQPDATYNAILLWSLPPSLTHLLWLLAVAQPASPKGHRVYLHPQSLPIPSPETLQLRLQSILEETQDIHLLRLAQQWWVAPSTVVAGLRSLGYNCEQFADTGSIEQELDKLRHWYRYSVADVANIVERFRTVDSR